MGEKTGDQMNRLTSTFSEWGIWAFSIGTSIGWGSFVVTCNTYLAQAGILGTVFGLLLGMAVILVINHNLLCIITKSQDAGGIYSYGKKIGGNDAGFLAAWFLLLTYMAVLWANATSLPLFAKIFLGDFFQVGYIYTVFGYDVYLGEVVLSATALLFTGLICARSRRLSQILMIVMALIPVAAILICLLAALFRHPANSFSFHPLFVPSRSEMGQIIRIAAISPWAFIGFENAAHFSEEYSFPVKKIKGILVSSVLVTTLLYVLLTLLSASAYPARYDSWFSYIRDMGNLEGLEAIPAFYAARHYLGNSGLYILMAALLSVVLSSLIGNLSTISRLLFAFGRDHEWTGRLGKTNRHHIPGTAVWLTAAVSCLVPLLGRTAIGWIVDVTTLCATLIWNSVFTTIFS